MSTIFQQNLRKKAAYDPDAEFQDAAFDTAEAPPRVAEPRPAVTQLPVVRESLIAADMSIEGKIEGKGNVRVAGRLEGDLNIQGDLIVNQGAQINGTLRARQVTLAGKLEGNIESAEKVELLESAVLIGDLKTGTLTIAAGSRVRGNIQCGWKDERAEPERAPRQQPEPSPQPEPELVKPAASSMSAIASNMQMNVSISTADE